VPTQAAIFIAFFLVFTAAFVVLARYATASRQAKEDALKQAASLRGWAFSKRNEHGYRIYAFSGVTDGIAWQAESAKLLAARNRRDRRRHIARWHGRWSPGVTAPIVGMGVPTGKETMAVTAGGDGMIARMAQKAVGLMFDKAIDVYFGKAAGEQVDAEELRRVESISVPGFVLMAKDVAEATRILNEGLQRALVEATTDTRNVLSEENRPWVLVRSQGVSLARMDEIRKIDELERFITAGVALSRSFRFGRPIA
jgi:hypothetical protein